jgi:DNA (cytosine-5)-methyltransferase 1
LFSGCGGLSLGLENAGFRVRAAVEIDPTAAAVYRKNHPRTFVIEKDIRKVELKDLRKAAGIGNRKLDLLAGCPPCQGFSRIKTKNKPISRDPRNSLVLHYLRIAKGLRPKMVLLENVPGLAKDRRFKKMLRELEDIGYKTDWDILNAADFGVPQRRKRLIMMASLVDKIQVPDGNGVRKTVRQTIKKLKSPRLTRDALQKIYLKSTPRIKKLIAKIPRNGGSRTALGKRAQLECHKKTEGFKDIYGRMSWDDVAPTLTGGCYNPSRGRFLHPTQNRPITLREAALLQTFPRHYSFKPASGLIKTARLIGDALPPAFGEAQAEHLMNHVRSSGR